MKVYELYKQTPDEISHDLGLLNNTVFGIDYLVWDDIAERPDFHNNPKIRIKVFDGYGEVTLLLLEMDKVPFMIVFQCEESEDFTWVTQKNTFLKAINYLLSISNIKETNTKKSLLPIIGDNFF